MAIMRRESFRWAPRRSGGNPPTVRGGLSATKTVQTGRRSSAAGRGRRRRPMFPEEFEFPAEPINRFIDGLIHRYAPAFDAVSERILIFLLSIHRGLEFIPWWGYILLVFLLSLYFTRSVLRSLVLASLPLFIGIFGLWNMAIESLAVIVASVVMALAIGLPLGVLMGEARSVSRPVPVLMQTMPSFVYLSGHDVLRPRRVFMVIATLIYPPSVIRLTALGISRSPRRWRRRRCTGNKWQLIRGPFSLAMPSIMAGVQTLRWPSPVVVSSMIGPGVLDRRFWSPSTRSTRGAVSRPE